MFFYNLKEILSIRSCIGAKSRPLNATYIIPKLFIKFSTILQQRLFLENFNKLTISRVKDFSALHKKLNFALNISSVNAEIWSREKLLFNVNRYAGNCQFTYLSKNFLRKNLIFCAVVMATRLL